MHLPEDLGTDQVTKPETITKTETLVNLQRQAQQFEATLTSPAGMTGTVSPVNGTVESLNQVPITLTFDSFGVAAGTYPFSLGITTRYEIGNTSEWRETTAQVPYELEVKAVASPQHCVVEVWGEPALGTDFTKMHIIPVRARLAFSFPQGVSV